MPRSYAGVAALSAAFSYCCDLTFARHGKRACPSFRAAIDGGDYATASSVHFVRCIISRARYPGSAAITSLSQIRPEVGLDPLITTKEPAYFVMCAPSHIRNMPGKLPRSFLPGVLASSSRALGIARVHDRLRRELRVPFSFNTKLPQSRG